MTTRLIIILLLTVSMFGNVACKKDKKKVVTPHNPNSGELITTLKLIMVDSANTSVVKQAVFRDIDGIGGNGPSVFDSIKLNANRTYYATVILLDESKSPVDSISNEVQEEADEHQFFYTVSGANLSVEYLEGEDVDSHGVPLGMTPKFRTRTASRGSLKVTLKHQPDEKPRSGNGDINVGETDIEINFGVSIQ